MRVGEKETSEQAAIVARYAESPHAEQLEALREAEAATTDVARESIARLRLTCQEGIVTRELAEQEDALENALLGARVPWDGEELPLRSAQARLALEPEYTRRDALGDAVLAVSTTFDEERRALLVARDGLESDVSGVVDPVTRQEDVKQVSLRPILDAVDRAGASRARRGLHARARALVRPSARAGARGDGRPRRAWRGSGGSRPSRRSTRRSEASLSASPPSSGSLTRPRGRARDPARISRTTPRSRRAPASSPPTRRAVVHLITRAQGGLPRLRGLPPRGGSCAPLRRVRHQWLPLCVPQALPRPRADRDLLVPARLDHGREPDWHAEATSALDDGGSGGERRGRGAVAPTRSSSGATRRSSATGWTSGRASPPWARSNPTGTRSASRPRLGCATGPKVISPDMDAGFYSADYLRAWIRAARVPTRISAREIGEDWWRNAGHGRLPPRPLRRGHAADDRGGGRAPRVRAARHRRAHRGT